MLEPAGDFGFEQKPLAAVGIVGVVVKDLFEGDLAMELVVEGDKYGSQAAAGVPGRSTRKPPDCPRSSAADGVRGGAVEIDRLR